MTTREPHNVKLPPTWGTLRQLPFTRPTNLHEDREARKTPAQLLAIDPGCTHSAFVLYSLVGGIPVHFGKLPNETLIGDLRLRLYRFDSAAIEMVACYGMAVGKEVFETVRWIGRFEEAIYAQRINVELVYRKDVKMHLCGNVRAKDPNIRQAIIDRYGGKEKAIGKKKTPGPCYGMAADVWAAMAVAVTTADRGIEISAATADAEGGMT